MGEFHYSRYPADEWEVELRKLRAGGIDIVASYVLWNHHEDIEGIFDWSGRRDLRRFVGLAARVGLRFFLRPGPWVHAESRNGGFPDWLLATGELRCNDPGYLGRVARFYGEIGAQLRGLSWSAGGPVLGVQLENEYGRTGPGAGAEHIAELKRLAIAAGLVVPLYTVTGWPNLDIPLRDVVPVSGAYADGFWFGGTGPLPPSGVFVFNTSRAIGEMGNVEGTPASAAIDIAHPISFRYPRHNGTTRQESAIPNDGVHGELRRARSRCARSRARLHAGFCADPAVVERLPTPAHHADGVVAKDRFD